MVPLSQYVEKRTIFPKFGIFLSVIIEFAKQKEGGLLRLRFCKWAKAFLGRYPNAYETWTPLILWS